MKYLDANAPQGIIRLKQLQARTGLSRAAIYARMKFNPKRPRDYDPTFPRPISLGASAVGWISAEIDMWIAGLVQQRDQGMPIYPGASARQSDITCEHVDRNAHSRKPVLTAVTKSLGVSSALRPGGA